MNPGKQVFIAALAVFCSCSSNNIPKASSDFTQFPGEKTLDEQKKFPLEYLAPDGLLLANDSTLVIRNATGKSATHFTSWNVNSQKTGNSWLPVGRKPGQSLSFLSFGSFDNKIWVNDMVKEEVMLVNLDTSLHQPALERKMPVFYYSLQLVNDSIAVGAGDYESDYKIALLNLGSGKISERMIPYKPGSATPLPREEKMAYESFLFLRPGGEKCVLACRYADQIEIVDLSNKSSKIIRGPEGYAPDVLVATGNDGKPLSTRNENTRYAFVKGKTTKDFIYLLYSGHNHLSEHMHYGSYLYVYDWEGNPVKKLKFRSDVLDFAVTSDDKTIYAYHPGSKSISVSNGLK